MKTQSVSFEDIESLVVNRLSQPPIGNNDMGEITG